MPGTSDEAKTPGRTRSTRLSFKDAGTPIGTPTRITRRTSLLDETVAEGTPTRQTRSTRRTSVDTEAAEAPPTPRRMTRRTSTEADIVTPSTTTTARVTRRSSVDSEHIPTPARITRRRSPSIQSNDGTQPQSVAKAPAEPTIMEVDDTEMATATPERKSRKSSTSMVTTVIEEEEVSGSPSRPVTRSMSQSPASVISPKKIEEQHVSPLTSPKKSSKRSSLSQESNTSITENKTKGTPNNKLNNSSLLLKSSPLKEKKSSESEQDLQIKMMTDKELESSTQETTSSQQSVGKKERKKKDMFSRSWSQPVVSQYKQAIDTFKLNKSAGHVVSKKDIVEIKHKKKSLMVESSSEEEDDENDDRNSFVEDEAEDVNDYESGDSMNEYEKEAHIEELKTIESQGIELGSEDSEDCELEQEDDDYEGSFITSDESMSLLSVEDEDEGITGNNKNALKSDDETNNSVKKGSEKKKKKRSLIVDSDSDQNQKLEKPVKSPAKELPKIRVHKKISTGDPDVSFKPTEVTIFDAAKINQELGDIDEEAVLDLNKSENGDETVKKRRKSIRVSDADRLSLSPMKSSTILKGRDKQLDKSLPLPKVPHNSVVSNGDNDILQDSNGVNHVNKSCNEVEPMDISVCESTQIDCSSMNISKQKSVLNVSQKLVGESSDDEYEEPDSDSVNESDVEMHNDDDDVVVEESKENVSMNTSKKAKKSVENVNELGAKFRASQLNSLATVRTPQQLKSIAERCEKILLEKKQEKKKSSALQKKKKEEKKKLKIAEKEANTAEDNEESGLKKKKKKKKSRRTYNKDLDSEPNEPTEKLKQKLETIERRRQKNKEKKLAKRQKLQEEGVEIVKRIKAPEEIPNPVVEKQVKKKKTLLTAFEARKMILGVPEIKVHKEKKSKNLNQQNTEPITQEKVLQVEKPETTKTESILQENQNTHNLSKPEKKENQKPSGVQEIIINQTNISVESDCKEQEPVKVSKKKKVQIDSQNKENQGKLLKIFSGFNEIPETPEAVRLKKNRGFVEQAATPRPIGFKVSSILPSGQEYTQRKTKKRKRTEKEIKEPSRAPPKPVWSASGAFEEIETSSNFISLNANTATEFKLSVLQQPPTKKRIVAQEGFSFKQKALFDQKLNLRQTSKDLLRQRAKQRVAKNRK